MPEPTMTCTLCKRQEVVRPDGRGFPPDIAKRKLKKRCNAAGCTCDPSYLAGYDPSLARLLGQDTGKDGTDG